MSIQSNGSQEGSRNSADEETRVIVAAHRLAVIFTEESNLPIRFKESSSAKARKTKEDSKVEQRFRVNVNSWMQLIKTMLTKISSQQAWRFIDLTPEVDLTVQKLPDCKDFCDFVDYLILRRDKEKCSADELGGLALLSIEFQRKIEKRFQTLSEGEKSEPPGTGDA